MSNGPTDLRCTVCRRPKHSLRPRKSKLKSDLQMFLCNECFDGKREPRFLIVLIARQDGGLSVVKDYIRSQRYFGDKIRAEELV